jgi:hypothetical protein
MALNGVKHVKNDIKAKIATVQMSSHGEVVEAHKTNGHQGEIGINASGHIEAGAGRNGAAALTEKNAKLEKESHESLVNQLAVDGSLGWAKCNWNSQGSQYHNFGGKYINFMGIDGIAWLVKSGSLKAQVDTGPVPGMSASYKGFTKRVAYSGELLGGHTLVIANGAELFWDGEKKEDFADNEFVDVHKWASGTMLIAIPSFQNTKFKAYHKDVGTHLSGGHTQWSEYSPNMEPTSGRCTCLSPGTCRMKDSEANSVDADESLFF